MRPVTIVSILAPICLSLLSGCAGSVQSPAKAPVKETASVEADKEIDVAFPSFDAGPPGSMEMAFRKPAPPPKKEVKPRKSINKPQLVSSKRKHGQLFVLPTKFEH